MVLFSHRFTELKDSHVENIFDHLRKQNEIRERNSSRKVTRNSLNLRAEPELDPIVEQPEDDTTNIFVPQKRGESEESLPDSSNLDLDPEYNKKNVAL